ncbi:MAG: hypothetical protein BWY25_01553 [Chloroflexi bacterium ADurb.Bin222]|nr:MAG: hypothetical protein BWY25_01553 [Chloroflexi bacterium ADurb.Bin222]
MPGMSERATDMWPACINGLPLKKTTRFSAVVWVRLEMESPA